MAKKKKQPVFKSGDRAVFMFSFHEHDNDLFADEDGDPIERPVQEIVQTVASWDWEYQRKADEDDIADGTEQELTSVKALSTHVKEEMGHWPAGALRIPFDKLKALMERDGWKFVCGNYTEEEGNHNDTEIDAILEKL